MTPELKTHLLGTFRSIQSALLAWNWGEAAEHFHNFCERHREAIPDWYEDEFVFAAMKLWEADRQPQVLRHFAIFFDRALGGEDRCWADEAAEPFRHMTHAIAAS